MPSALASPTDPMPDLVHRTFVSLLKSQSKAKEGRIAGKEAMAKSQGLSADVVGRIDSTRFVGFIRQVAGRPNDAPARWKRELPLMIVLDNHSVHRSQTGQSMKPVWGAADIFLAPLPATIPHRAALERPQAPSHANSMLSAYRRTQVRCRCCTRHEARRLKQALSIPMNLPE